MTKDQNDIKPSEKNTLELTAVVDGEIIPIEDVEDQIFAGKMIGDGFGIRPNGKKVYSPVDATIEQIASTKHAIYLSTSDNIKILIHIGIDTIELKGKGFEGNLEKGMFVNKGDVLVEFDPKYIIDEGFNPVVSVIILGESSKGKEITVYPTEDALANKTIALTTKPTHWWTGVVLGVVENGILADFMSLFSENA